MMNIFRFIRIPTKNFVNIKICDETIESLNIFNFNGQYLKSYKLQKGTNTFNISQYSKGVYIVKLLSKEGIKTSKLVVK